MSIERYLSDTSSIPREISKILYDKLKTAKEHAFTKNHNKKLYEQVKLFAYYFQDSRNFEIEENPDFYAKKAADELKAIKKSGGKPSRAQYLVWLCKNRPDLAEDYYRKLDGREFQEFDSNDFPTTATADILAGEPPSVPGEPASRNEHVNVSRSADAMGQHAEGTAGKSTGKVSRPDIDYQGWQPPTFEEVPSLTRHSWLSPLNPEAIPYVGRSAEQAKLDEFVCRDDRFLIWAIVGPSGVGKTRLTIEWMRRSSVLNGWRKCVLRSPADRDGKPWAGWSLVQPTQIVIDDMFSFADVIRTIIRRCCEAGREEGLAFPVRLLLIDRVFPDDLSRLGNDVRWGLTGVSTTDLDRIRELFFGGEPLRLADAEDQDNVVEKIFSNTLGDDFDKSVVREALNYLRNMTDVWQPLFAALFGNAARTALHGGWISQEFLNWNRHHLIHYYLKYHLKGDDYLPWHQSGRSGKLAGCFVAAATALGGVAFDTLFGHLYPDERTSPAEYRGIINTCKRIVSSKDDFVLPPFEPDILGLSFFFFF